MPTYYVNEAVFSLPERTFVDRTLHRFESPLPGSEDPLQVEIRRVPMGPGKPLRRLVDDEIADKKAKVNGFTLVDEAEVALSGAPAIVLRARLRARDGVYHQLQAHVAVEGTWLAIVVTGPAEERAACEDTFERIVRGIAWRTI
jgi:hypothetical protein